MSCDRAFNAILGDVFFDFSVRSIPCSFCFSASAVILGLDGVSRVPSRESVLRQNLHAFHKDLRLRINRISRESDLIKTAAPELLFCKPGRERPKISVKLLTS